MTQSTNLPAIKLPQVDLTIASGLVVTTNIDDVKKIIAAIMEQIKATDYDDAGAKGTKADLNKARDLVKKKAAQFKADCMAPIDAILADFKVIDGLFVEAYDLLNTQVAASMARRKEEKQKEIDGLFNGYADKPKWINLSAIQRPEWLNVATPISRVKSEIYSILDRIMSEHETIMAMPDGDRAIAIEVFKKTLNLAAAMDAVSRFKQQQEAVKQAQQDKLAKQETPPAPPAPRAHTPVKPQERSPAAHLDEVLTGRLTVGRGTFSITGKRANINKWLNVAASLGITIDKVEG